VEEERIRGLRSFDRRRVRGSYGLPFFFPVGSAMTSSELLSASFGAALLSLILLCVAGCGSESGGGDLEVVEPRLVETPNGQRAFTGTLVNGGGAPISIAQIEVALYDDEGSPVERIQIEVKDVPARDSLDFSQTIDSDEPFSQAQVQSVYRP
jgi:hypothetical protein